MRELARYYKTGHVKIEKSRFMKHAVEIVDQENEGTGSVPV